MVCHVHMARLAIKSFATEWVTFIFGGSEIQYYYYHYGDGAFSGLKCF